MTRLDCARKFFQQSNNLEPSGLRPWYPLKLLLRPSLTVRRHCMDQSNPNSMYVLTLQGKKSRACWHIPNRKIARSLITLFLMLFYGKVLLINDTINGTWEHTSYDSFGMYRPVALPRPCEWVSRSTSREFRWNQSVSPSADGHSKVESWPCYRGSKIRT